MNVSTKSMSRTVHTLKLISVSVLLIAWAIGCSSSSPVSPEKFVLNFLQKHVSMIDRSVVDFYVKEERAGVMSRVDKFIAEMKQENMLQSLKAATYDFSKIKVAVLDQKEEYVNDEPINFVKVAVKGDYTKIINGKSEALHQDETIILESVSGKWKVTEKINPWD